MKAQEAHKMTNEEIAEELRRLSRKLFDLRSQSVTEKVEDVSQFTKMRRDIARLQTERRAREIAQNEKANA
mgnify:CR=1 FL=1